MSKPLSPHELHEVLEVSPSIRLRFWSEKKLLSYRAMLYSVNKQGKFPLPHAAARPDGTGYFPTGLADDVGSVLSAPMRSNRCAAVPTCRTCADPMGCQPAMLFHGARAISAGLLAEVFLEVARSSRPKSPAGRPCRGNAAPGSHRGRRSRHR
jgi:hypothetical protein